MIARKMVVEVVKREGDFMGDLLMVGWLISGRNDRGESSSGWVREGGEPSARHHKHMPLHSTSLHSTTLIQVYQVVEI